MAYWRPPIAYLYSVLRSQRSLFMVHNAATERSDGWTTGRPDEDDAMDDVSHAGILLLHVQRLFVGPKLLLLYFAVFLGSHYVDSSQNDKRRKTPGYIRESQSRKQKESAESKRSFGSNAGIATNAAATKR